MKVKIYRVYQKLGTWQSCIVYPSDRVHKSIFYILVTWYERRTTCGVVIVMTLHIQESKDYMNHQNQHAITECSNNSYEKLTYSLMIKLPWKLPWMFNTWFWARNNGSLDFKFSVFNMQWDLENCNHAYYYMKHSVFDNFQMQSFCLSSEQFTSMG